MTTDVQVSRYKAGQDPCPYVKNYALFPEDPDYDKYEGESKNTWLVANVLNAGDRVYRTAKPDNSGGEGFGGATLLFRCKDNTQFALKGGFHANSMDLYKDTRIDVRDKHSTKVTIAEKQSENSYMALEDVIYSEEWQIGPYLRGDFLVQKLANKHKRRLYGIVEGMGGSHTTAASPVTLISTNDIVNPSNEIKVMLESFSESFMNPKNTHNTPFSDEGMPKTIAGLICTCWANKETKEQLSFTKESAFEFIKMMHTRILHANLTNVKVGSMLTADVFEEAKYNKKNEAKSIENTVFKDNKPWIFVDVPCHPCMTAEALVTGRPVDLLFQDCRCVYHETEE